MRDNEQYPQMELNLTLKLTIIESKTLCYMTQQTQTQILQPFTWDTSQIRLARMVMAGVGVWCRATNVY